MSKKDGKPLFTPAISLKVGELNIGVTAITDRLPPKSTVLGESNEILGWQKVLPTVLEGLTAKNDFIILLANLDDKECKEIAKAHPAIKIIIQAKSFPANKEPVRISPATILTRTGKQGKYVGVMDIKWHQGSNWQAPRLNSILAVKKSERDRLNRQLARSKNRPDQRNNYLNIEKRLKQIEAEINELARSSGAVAGTKPTDSSYRNRFISMAITMPDDPAVQEVVNEINTRLAVFAEKARKKNKPGNFSATGFAGWRKCRPCHQEYVRSWQRTRHASSYLTLVEDNQQFNLDCLPCHVTGFKPNDPAAALSLPADLQMVGCEVCHGPQASHLAAPARTKPKQPVSEKICLNCHTADRDKSFDFARDRTKVHLVVPHK